MDIIDLILKYKEAFLTGLYTTLTLCIWVWTLGIIIGSTIGYFSIKKFSFSYKVATIFSSLLSGIPILVLLYWLYYPMQQYMGIEINPLTIAIIAFSLINIFIVADIVRQSLMDLPEKFLLAGKVTGLSKKTILYRIQLPLLIRSVLGPILIVQVTMLHNSIFASLINVDEIFRQIQRVNSIEYKPIELYSILAIFFMCISIPLNSLANYLKKKYSF